MTPTQRTLKYLRDVGYLADVIERWIPIPKIPGGGKRKDFLGFADILAFNSLQTLLVQSCGSNYSEHVKKIKSSEFLPQWLESKNRRFLLLGWRKVKKKRGGKLMVFKPRVGIFWLNKNGSLGYSESE